jgi:hypothetical protein
MNEPSEPEDESPKWAIGCLLMFVGAGATAIISGILSQIICRKIWGVDYHEERQWDFFPIVHFSMLFLAAILAYSFAMLCLSHVAEPQRRFVCAVALASLITTIVAVFHGAGYPWEPFFD